ncbi:MAG: NADH-quinone oxidoreductase subunit NuoH [Chloroflexi bacterium]|nr:NADH-quinone oxidoreductase subunit NuoH [Chloroflexota bacterium]
MEWLGTFWQSRDFEVGLGQPIYAALTGAGVPGWLVSILYPVVGAATILGIITVSVMMALWLERKGLARMQDRYGPNRVGPFGLGQSPADVVKLLSKEVITPRGVDRLLHYLGPILVLSPSLLMWAVVPWGPGLQVADLNVAVLYLVAFGSIPVLGITLAGWGSNNKYSLLGGMRAVVQYVSYEVPAALTLVIPVLLAGTLSLQGIVSAQSGPFWNWFIFKPIIVFPVLGIAAFVLYLIGGLAEANRTPFDHVEADSELVAGFQTEYAGMQWALFMLAEYGNSIAISLLGSTLFLGGYHTGLGDWFDDLIWPLLPGVLATKAAVIFAIFVWIRGSLPRFRYDQLMGFAWKRMLPAALFLISVTAVLAPWIRSVPVAR